MQGDETIIRREGDPTDTVTGDKWPKPSPQEGCFNWIGGVEDCSDGGIEEC